MTFQAGAIVTRVGGDLGPLRGAFAQAKGLAGNFVSEFAGVLTAGIGAALGAHALRSAMEGIDDAAKAADRLGMSTESLVALRHEADLAGVDTESLGMSLQFLQRSLADAANGAGPARDALDRLGLSGKQLIAMPLESALGRIGDALNNVENPTQRAAAAMDLFGARGGPRLLSLLSEGSAGVRQAQEDAERLGITFSRLDARKVEEANDAMTNLGAAARGLATQLAVRMAPAMKAATDFMAGLVVSVHNLNPEVLGAAAGMLKWGVAIGAAVAIAPRLVAIGGAIVKMYQSIAKGEAIVLALSGPKGWAALVVGAAVAAVSVAAIDRAFASATKSATAAGTAAKGAAAAAAKASASLGTLKPVDMTDHGAELATKAQFEVINALERQSYEAGKTRDQVAMMDLAWANASDAVRSYAANTIAATRTAEALADVRKRVEEFGMTDRQKAVSELGATPGVTIRQLQQVDAMYEKLEKLEAGKKLTDQAKQFLEEIKTPAEKAMEVVDALQEAFAAGKITAQQFDRGLTAARKQAADGEAAAAQKRQPTTDLPTLVRAGSADAVRLAFQAQQSSGQQQYQKQHLAKLDTLIDEVRQGKVEIAMTEDE